MYKNLFSSVLFCILNKLKNGLTEDYFTLFCFNMIFFSLLILKFIWKTGSRMTYFCCVPYKLPKIFVSVLMTDKLETQLL